jgi:hypothetical protein
LADGTVSTPEAAAFDAAARPLALTATAAALVAVSRTWMACRRVPKLPETAAEVAGCPEVCPALAGCGVALPLTRTRAAWLSEVHGWLMAAS